MSSPAIANIFGSHETLAPFISPVHPVLAVSEIKSPKPFRFIL